MKILDFWKKEQPVAVEPPAPAQMPAKKKTLAEMVGDPGWTFPPVSADSPNIYSHDNIRSAAAVYSAQQMRRIANDIEAIRKYMTRLKLVDDGKDDLE